MSAGLLVAGPAHAEAMAAIHAACFPPCERWDAGSLGVLAAQPGAAALIDPEGGFVLLRLAADEAEILTLAVLPALRRRGRGRALLRAAAALARARGARALFLEVAGDSPAALALYDSEGFREVGRRAGYYAHGADALVLRRALDVRAADGHGSRP